MPKLILALFLLTAFSVRAEPPSLRIATWNLEHLAAKGDDGCRPRSEADYERLRHHATRLNADIVALQEVENATAVGRVFDPTRYAIEISGRPTQDLGTCRQRRSQERTMQRTGFAIDKARLAELGLTYRRQPDFEAIGTESRRWAAGILLESLANGGTPLQLLSLHLKSGCSYGRLVGRVKRGQCRILVQQRGILEEWIDARAIVGDGFVLLGDFNRQLDQPNDDFWSEIDDATVCAWILDPVLGRKCSPETSRKNPGADLVLANAGIPFPFPYNPRYPYAVDHIVLDAGTAERLVPDSYVALDYGDDDPAPSDHHPVAISLRVTQRP